MTVASARIGLPELNEGAGHGPGVLVQDAAIDDDARTDRIPVLQVADEVVIERSDLSCPKVGPVISEIVLSSDRSACCGERSTEVLYCGVKAGGCQSRSR